MLIQMDRTNLFKSDSWAVGVVDCVDKIVCFIQNNDVALFTFDLRHEVNKLFVNTEWITMLYEERLAYSHHSKSNIWSKKMWKQYAVVKYMSENRMVGFAMLALREIPSDCLVDRCSNMEYGSVISCKHNISMKLSEQKHLRQWTCRHWHMVRS